MCARLAVEGARHSDVVRAALGCRRATPRASAAAVLARVQGLPYREDNAGSRDVIRPPCRTLVEGGDCDCLATLAAALDEVLGLPWRIGWIVQPTAAQDHVAPQVYLARAWWWQDVTIPGALLGESPREAVARVGFRRRVEGGA